MTAKEYLSQARHLDARIDAKIKQVSYLNGLAVNATSALNGMPHSPNKGTSRMANIVEKIVDLQAEINADIDELVDLKREISAMIKSVPDTNQQTVLEKRYLCFESWEQIAIGMGFSLHYLYKVHAAALDFCDEILKEDTWKHRMIP